MAPNRRRKLRVVEALGKRGAWSGGGSTIRSCCGVACSSPSLPLHLRKNNLARLLARRPEGIFVSDFEQGEIGPDLFRAACQIGLEGMVSKRRDSTYCAGRSPHLSAICWQTLAISERTSYTTRSMLRRIARSPRGAHRAGRCSDRAIFRLKRRSAAYGRARSEPCPCRR